VSRALICFEDEAGQNLRPQKARTWAPRGRTPVVRVSGKGSGRVSVAGLVCLKPSARGHLYYRVRIHRGRKGERRSMSEADYAGLITAAHQELQAPVILIWDRLNTHVSAVMRTFIQAHPGWLTEVRLPAYAPELNPAEIGLPQCELRRSPLAWLPGSLSVEVSIGVPSSVQRRRLW
jgi:DDE superfamily endonuclease